MVEQGADENLQRQISDEHENELVHRLLRRGEFVLGDFEVEHHFGELAGINGDAVDEFSLFQRRPADEQVGGVQRVRLE